MIIIVVGYSRSSQGAAQVQPNPEDHHRGGTTRPPTTLPSQLGPGVTCSDRLWLQP